MKLSELKKIIRKTVRECVNEMLAEKFLENISTQSKPPSLREAAKVRSVAEEVRSEPETRKPTKRDLNEKLINRLGINKSDAICDIFSDTLANNQIMDGEENIDPPHTISEAAMRKSGLMDKDWSMYFNAGETTKDE